MKNNLKVLFVSNEATGIYKIGGLGDVASGLCQALSALEIDIRLCLPLHPEVDTSGLLILDTFEIIYHHLRLNTTVYQSFVPNSKIPVYFISEPTYISRSTDASDNHADKYAVFSLAVSTWIHQYSFWQPHVIHLNEWHSSLIPLIFKHLLRTNEPKFLLTLHNLAYQANTTTPVISKLAISEDACTIVNYDHRDAYINILYEGIAHADYITTVSPNHAAEILTPEFGFGLEDILNQKKSRLSGILNGIDTSFFNPANDKLITTKYDSKTYDQGKKSNKIALLNNLNLNPTIETLIVYIGRIDSKQKGIDIILSALASGQFPPPGTHFIFLGTGEPSIETRLQQAAVTKNATVICRFDEVLAHRLYASGDLVIIPSHYEPCGLVQMIAMRYGTLPIAHSVGGLFDTIDHKNTGFLYSPNSHIKFIEAVHDALAVTHNQPIVNEMIEKAMKKDFSWHRAAQEYVSIYHDLNNT